MNRVKGIGGIFFRASDHESTREWYKKHLGIPVTEDGCAVFKWRDPDNPEKEQATIWSTFPEDTEYFAHKDQRFMVNYIVESLDEVLGQLRSEGVKVDEKIVESEFGKFGWLYDPDGNKIELWEPPR